MTPILSKQRDGGDLWSWIDHQLAHPKGVAGRLLGHIMVPLNRAPNERAVAALAPQAGEAILEVGFGPGQALGSILAAAPGCRLHGIDRSAEMVDQARRRNMRAGGTMDLRVGSLFDLPWPDASFDKILAVNVAYFFDQEGVAARELHRVLRPGGRLVLYVTDSDTMKRWRLAGPETHRLYGEADLEAMLAAAGFAPENIRLTPVALPLKMRGWMATAERSRMPTVMTTDPAEPKASASW
ncbi:class I SAM-dependent methyltransferase [Pleomorphomonas sp. PLEO]|uniref:class I SAM-dependent methyltransferase n=1 Tax=Pleomorphomonas sp. PLEO TaxID=3239306 RepID=UPI00351E3149